MEAHIWESTAIKVTQPAEPFFFLLYLWGSCGVIQFIYLFIFLLFGSHIASECLSVFVFADTVSLQQLIFSTLSDLKLETKLS